MDSVIQKYNYGNDPREVVKRYSLPDIQKTDRKVNLYIFIHGGAWRDPNNTCDDFDKFSHNILRTRPINSQREIEIYSIDYKLSPVFKHPDFLHDIVRAVIKILQIFNITNIDELSKTIDKVCICGHSVGATLALQLINCGDFKSISFLNETDKRLLGILLKQKVTNLILLEGIYNLRSMLEAYPEYKGFVEEAHESLNHAYKATEFTDLISTKKSENFKILIVHSKKDELLSLTQPNEFIENYKRNFNISKIYDDFGKHNDVYVNENVCSIIIEETKFI